MAMNPLEQRGMAIDDQFRSWTDLMVDPYDKREVDPYTRTRVILMNGIEVESIIFSHQFHRHTDSRDIREHRAMTRRAEQQQQKVVNGLNPGDQSPLETTIGYEQVAVDLTAWLARQEPDPAVKLALDFALLEDFDHLYRYANLYELMDGEHAEQLTDSLTEITPGRPTIFHHRHPRDSVNGHYDTHTVHPLTRLHVMTIVAAEQQTRAISCRRSSPKRPSPSSRTRSTSVRSWPRRSTCAPTVWATPRPLSCPTITGSSSTRNGSTPEVRPASRSST